MTHPIKADAIRIEASARSEANAQLEASELIGIRSILEDIKTEKLNMPSSASALMGVIPILLSLPLSTIDQLFDSIKFIKELSAATSHVQEDAFEYQEQEPAPIKKIAKKAIKKAALPKVSEGETAVIKKPRSVAAILRETILKLFEKPGTVLSREYVYTKVLEALANEGKEAITPYYFGVATSQKQLGFKLTRDYGRWSLAAPIQEA